jgi:alkanesulfonate monooxygenase SsuD/methylene tetrahydromethanopterin reductase-like flavin-dependent oxidoreductase (luciferase family)
MIEIGLHTLGIGAGARRDVIDAVAVSAAAAGFATRWAGEHVVLVDAPASPYPYAAKGRIAVPADADWLDPLVALSFAAAATSRIGLATGVLLVPERQPGPSRQAAGLAGPPVRGATDARRRMVARGVRGAGCPVRTSRCSGT